MSIRLSLALALALVAPATLVACGSDSATTDTTDVAVTTINVRGTVEPLSQLLTAIYTLAFENTGARVGRKDPAPDRATAYQALESGSTQLMVDSSTELLALLHAAAGTTPDPTKRTADEQTAALNGLLPDSLTVNAPALAETTPTVACTTDAANANSLTTISDLAAAGDAVKLGAPAAADLATLGAAYATTFTAITVEEADAATAIADGKVDCVLVSAVATVIPTAGLLPLTDDKKAYPTDAVVPVLAVSVSTGVILPVLTQVNAGLTTEVLRALLVKAEAGGGTYDVVARQFIESLAKGG